MDFIKNLLLHFLLSILSGRKSLETGQIAFKINTLPSGLHEVQATDGTVALEGVVSSGHGFLACRIDRSEPLIDAIISDPEVSVRTIGEKEIQELWQRCTVKDPDTTSQQNSLPDHRASGTNQRQLNKRDGYFPTTEKAPLTTTTTTTTGSSGWGNLPFKPEKTGDPQGAGSHIAIVPGTRWCGKGNVAETYGDLGRHRVTDSCCRKHDHCPYFIPALTRKYNTLNIKPWTISYCDCDQQFFQCLKANTNASATVGQLFFGMLGVQCFNFAQGEYCQEYHWTHLWCSQPVNGSMASIVDFPNTWESTRSPPVGK